MHQCDHLINSIKYAFRGKLSPFMKLGLACLLQDGNTLKHTGYGKKVIQENRDMSSKHQKGRIYIQSSLFIVSHTKNAKYTDKKNSRWQYHLPIDVGSYRRRNEILAYID